MIRNWVKSHAATVLCRTRMDRMWTSRSPRLPVVLGYHRVVEDFREHERSSIPSMLISRDMLARHLDWIGKRYRFVSLDTLDEHLEHQSAQKPVAAVTFDDGYQDFYDHALPLLQRKGIPATVFVVTDLVGANRPHIHDQLYLLLMRRWKRLGRLRWRPDGIRLPDIGWMTPFQATRVLLETLPLAAVEQVIQVLESEDEIPAEMTAPLKLLTWETLGRIASSGIVVGSHTRSHVVMHTETPSRIAEEAASSRNVLEQRLNVKVRHFAYPSGSFHDASVEAVAKAGYQFGFTGCTHRDPRHPALTVPRTILWEKSCADSSGAFSGSILSCQVHHAFDWASGCRHQHILGAY